VSGRAPVCLERAVVRHLHVSPSRRRPPWRRRPAHGRDV